MSLNKRHVAKENIIVILCFTLLIGLIFRQYIEKPSTLLPAAGDGMKNYFTYLYHLKHDSTYWKFEGMNYPFGENIVFTDNQPLLVNTVKFISKLVTLDSEDFIAIHNLIIFFGWIIGGLGLFLCFRRLKVSFLFSLLCSLGLILLQPQSMRLDSHFSMAYPFLPWIFLCWLEIWNKENFLKYSLFIGIITTAGGLLHMYHFVTITFLNILAIAFTFIFTKEKKEWNKILMGLGLQTVIPLVILQGVTYIHYVEGRPDNPWGFFNYHASWETLIFSYKLPLFEFINQNIVKIKSFDHNEGKSYIGLFSVILIIYGIYLLISKFRNSFSKFLTTDTISSKLKWIFLTSALISFGLPFVIPGLEWLLDYTGPFKQFRTIGRVAWVSFYAINLLTIPWLYEQTEKLNATQKPILRISIAIVIVIEGFLMLPNMNNPEHLKDSFSSQRSPIPINVKDYQAILPDPYIHIGSECFGWADLGGNQDQIFQITYQLGLPNMGVVMSRNALPQAMLLNELICKPYRVPSIIEILKQKDQRPLLVLESKLNLYNRQSSISHWTADAPIVYEHEQYRLRKLELNQFDTIVKYYNEGAKSQESKISNEKMLTAELKQKDGKWGLETVIMSDSTMNGEHLISFIIDVKSNGDVNAIIDTWQINKDHHLLERRSERINKYYFRIVNNQMYIQIPINLRADSAKLAIRISKDNPSLSDQVNISDFKLFKVK
jgi:hypothetical protein